MTVTVLATPTTKTKRRDALRPIDMATSQAQARAASSAAPGKSGRKGTRASTRLSLNSQEKNEEVSKRGKRKNSFDEDIEGFQFSRIPSKKAKPLTETIPELPKPIPDAAPQPSPRRGRPPKKRPEEKSDALAEVKEKKKEGVEGSTAKRQTRGAAKPPAPAEPEVQTQQPSDTRSMRKRDQDQAVPLEKKRRKGRPSKSSVEPEPEPQPQSQPQRNGYVSPEPQPSGTATIALPLADTPVIQRNKEMRGQQKSGKGNNRRSSLGMRGRRASSLIDSGASNALPHKEVGTADFYKHISSDGLPEPRRMRQLLTWCATRAMGEKPSGSRSEDESARLAARVIQEELLKDFSTNSELSNWFGREDTTPPAVVVKKPNPRNVQNTDKIKELEEQIQRLQKERHSLNALLRPPSIPQIKPAPKQADTTPNGQPEQSSQPESSSEPIDLSLLEPSQQKLLALIDPDAAKRQSTQPQGESSSETNTLPPMTPSTISTRLSRITTSLAPTLDSFAAGMHNIELYRAMSDTVSSQVLRICAERLEDRDTRNALRRLAIDEGEGEAAERKDLSLRPRPREDLGVILGALSRVERR